MALATLHALGDGSIVFVSGAPTSLPVVPPPGIASTLDLDAETNAALLTDVQLSRQYRLVGGVLTKDGVVITPAPDGPAGRDTRLLAAIRTKLDADTAPSAVELRVILRALLRRLG